MIRLYDKAIHLPEGDTASLTLTEFVKDLTIEDTDKLLFLLTDKDKNVILRKVLEPVDKVFTLNITREDVIPTGQYLWQIRQYVNGVLDEEDNLTGDEINTPFGPQVFQVTEVLGDGELHT